MAPVANDYWARAEFPFGIIDRFREPDPISWADPRSGDTPPSSLLAGFTAMELAHVDASVATFFGVHAGLAMGSVAWLGSEEQRRRWLPAMSRFEKIGAFALTETHGGSDVSGGLETTARRDGDSWVLNGSKRWIGNATFADLIVVWARDVDTKGVLGFVVEKGVPGYRASKIENKVALRIVQNADIVLEECRVPEGNRLQKASSFRDTAKVLRATRSGVAWIATGLMMGAYVVPGQGDMHGAHAGVRRLGPRVARRQRDSAAFARQDELIAGLFSSQDSHEGATAFAEKRPPHWQGR